MLYLEGFFRSAEIEYWSCLVFVHGALRLCADGAEDINTSITAVEISYIRSLCACCLLNIAVSRTHQPNAVHGSRHSLKPRFQDQAVGVNAAATTTSTRTTSQNTNEVAEDACAVLLNDLLELSLAMEMAPLDLCDYSLRLRDDAVGVMRKCFVLEKLKK